VKPRDAVGKRGEIEFDVSNGVGASLSPVALKQGTGVKAFNRTPVILSFLRYFFKPKKARPF